MDILAWKLFFSGLLLDSSPKTGRSRRLLVILFMHSENPAVRPGGADQISEDFRVRERLRFRETFVKEWLPDHSEKRR